ncbi:tyrosine-type recombinase/integrase [Desertibaculum subflavum]|uniref:tyrosine-type recombinase/integrase n=1 Tax=Desertibaculum subflavum TaxID=2268458 RepID=UPI000E674583
MPKRAAGLSAAKVKTAKPGRYGDGGGLFLLVREDGRRSWLFRYRVADASKRDGRRMREMGLGVADGKGAVTLAEAREKAGAALRQVRNGIDPLVARDAEREAQAAAAAAAQAGAVTFKQAVDSFLAGREAGWRNPKHRAQWRNTLTDYAGPHMGAKPVGRIDVSDVQKALTPIWEAKPETASRLRGRIEAVLDFARVQGWREGENPARWRGNLDHVFPRRSKVSPVEHHAALRWQEIGGFMADLRAIDGAPARALEFTIVCAARTGETLGALWPEIDMGEAVWTIPAGRMKAGKEHRVPLSEAALAVLRAMLPFKSGENTAVFPGRYRGAHLSNMAMAMTLRRMGRDDLTVHGMRSTFRDWAGETTAHPREVVEAALAHRLGDKVEQAYARGDLFQKRRVLMDDWAAFLATVPATVLRLGDHRPVTA